MKSKLLFFLFVVVLMGCDNEDTPDDVGCVRVKLVRSLCGQAILEIIDPTYFNKGQSWMDSSGEQYNNVFSTLIPCDFNQALNPGDEFVVQFTDELIGGNCAKCYALLEGPEKFNYVMPCLPACGFE